MFEEYKNKIELHCHTAPMSSCSDISSPELIRYYREAGYAGVVITNHFSPFAFKNKKKYNKYLDEMMEDFEFLCDLGESSGIKVYLGAELRFPESYNDYLLYGIDEEFLRGIPLDCDTPQAFVPYLRQHEDVLFIQAHPFRNGMTLCDPSLLDGIEVYNLHPHHNSRVGFAAKYAEEEGFKVSTCGSDFHHVGHAALSALLTKELPENEKALAKCIKNEQIYKVGNSIVTFPSKK